MRRLSREEYQDIYRYGRSWIWLEDAYWDASLYKKLNMGCGEKPFSGRSWTNLDYFTDGEDIVKWDLTELPLPFDDDEFDYILAMHILEHIPRRVREMPGDFLNHLLLEISRILVDGGFLEIHVPSSLNPHTLEHLGHERHVGRRTFEGLEGGNYLASSEKAKLVKKVRLKLVDFRRWHRVDIKGLTDFHLREYLGDRAGEFVSRVIGTPECERYVYRLEKVE